MKGSNKTGLTFGAIAVSLVLLLAINILVSTGVRSVRLDLTEEKLFTVSEGTRDVLGSIDETIRLNFYFSSALGEQSPGHANYAKRVRELLEHYVRLSSGKLQLSIFDPEPYSAIEDQAVAQGLFGIPLTEAGDRAYFGLVANNSTDDVQFIPLFDQRREAFLEYDLTRITYNLANPEKKVVGLIENVMMEGNPTRQEGPWEIIDQIRQFFTLRTLGTEFDKIAADVDILMIVHPQGMTEKTLYAIDQFVMRGGKVFVFLDPHAESVMQTARGREPWVSVSQFDKILESWGVKIDTAKFVADPNTAIRVGTKSGGRDVVVPYLGWLHLKKGTDADFFSSSDVVTSELEEIIFGVAGPITAVDSAKTTLTPIIQSGIQAAAMDAEPVRRRPDPIQVLKLFKPGNKRLILAARVVGPVNSAFPDGPPKVEEIKSAILSKKPGNDSATGFPTTVHIATAQQPLNAIIVGDVDMMADRFSVREQEFLGQRVAVPISSNGTFVINALDNLAGSEGLIGLRGRGVSQRPFTVIDKIRKHAEVSFRQKEEALQAKLKATETKLARLQTQGDGPDGRVILSDEQREAINEFRHEMLNTRQQLREVQHDQRSEIDQLHTFLTVTNIWAVPVLISIFALIIGIVRRARIRQRMIVA
jgi:ABC-type uncharacterized transport system involved in gliding motility auxiliary subunit